MTKQVKKYEDMNSEEKAQVIYNKLVQGQDTTTLSELILEISPEYSDDDVILTVEDWLESFSEEPSTLGLLVKISQKSKDLNIDDKYIRDSIYYAGYKTSNKVLDLISRDEAINWITRALYNNSPCIEDFNTAGYININ